MDSFSILLTAGVLLYFGFIIYHANQIDLTGERSPSLNWMLYSVIALVVMFGLLVLSATIQLPVSSGAAVSASPVVDPLAGGIYFVLTIAAGFLCARLIVSPTTRIGMRRLFGAGVYNPESSVHLTALVFIIAFMLYNFGQFILGGGISGLAESYAQGISTEESLFSEVLWVLFAALGVGLFIRRSGAQTLERLGLKIPTGQEVIIGIGVGLGMIAFILALGMLWELLVTPEQLAEQTAASRQLAQGFDSLSSIFLLAISVSLGEEIFFRGALQPIFGIGFTSVFFSLLHTQYTLTPATIGIFFVSLIIGWLRLRYNTTTAIIAHFVYNFVQLFLVFLAGSLLGGV